MTKTFKVDQDCINNGIQDTIGFCPVALSVKKTYKDVEVSTTQIGIGPVEDTIFFENTDQLEQWIRDFDDDKKVQEMQVCLDFEKNVASIEEDKSGSN